MATTLLSSTYRDFGGYELTDFCNQQSRESHESIAEAVLMLGLSVVGAYVLPGISNVIAQRIVSALSAIGIADSVANIADMIQGNGGATQREAVINNIKTYGGKMRVTTNYYEYMSGSGNSYTRYTTTTYSWVA